MALQQRSGVAPAFGRRRYTSGASSAARGSITRAARASLRKELSWALVNAGWSQSQCGLPKWPGRGHRTCPPQKRAARPLQRSFERCSGCSAHGAQSALKRSCATLLARKCARGGTSRARGDHHMSRGRELKPRGLPGAAAGAPARDACEESDATLQTDTKEILVGKSGLRDL